jgi:hypothetical protein
LKNKRQIWYVEVHYFVILLFFWGRDTMNLFSGFRGSAAGGVEVKLRIQNGVVMGGDGSVAERISTKGPTYELINSRNGDGPGRGGFSFRPENFKSNRYTGEVTINGRGRRVGFGGDSRMETAAVLEICMSNGQVITEIKPFRSFSLSPRQARGRASTPSRSPA